MDLHSYIEKYIYYFLYVSSSEYLVSPSEGLISAMKSFTEIQNIDLDVVDLLMYTVILRHTSVIFDTRLRQYV